MTMLDALVNAMNLPADSDTMHRLHESGLAVANENTVSQAIHDVYCGIMADHHEPNDNDREQAKALMAALQKHAATTE